MQKRKTQKNPLVISLIVLLGIALSLLLLSRKTRETSRLPVYVVSEPQSTPAPVDIAPLTSPDGTHILRLENKGNVITLLANDNVVLMKSLTDSEEILLPFNAWSPDNKYFFVEDKQMEHSAYLVMKTDGTPVAEIVALFNQVQPELSLTEVTGWASPTLLIVNAKSENGTLMSFWFDIHSQKFIRLSGYFN